MKNRYGVHLLILAALIAIFTALAHMSCIVLGPQCYAFQMAPPPVVESAKAGTLLAPIGTTIVSSIFVVFALYALSGASVIRRLPLLNIGIYTISGLCIVRGLLGIQLWVRHPELVNTFSSIANFVWFITGLLFLVGYRTVKKSQAAAAD